MVCILVFCFHYNCDLVNYGARHSGSGIDWIENTRYRSSIGPRQHD